MENFYELKINEILIKNILVGKFKIKFLKNLEIIFTLNNIKINIEMYNYYYFIIFFIQIYFLCSKFLYFKSLIIMKECINNFFYIEYKIINEKVRNNCS